MRKLILVLACAILAGAAIANADEKLVDLVKKVKPCVVFIETFDKDNNPIAQGSGFFIDNKGSLITNHHVIEGAYSATIKTSSGKVYPVQGIIAKDTEADIVKLVVNLPDANITFLNLSVNMPSEGEDIFVIGNPLGLESTVSSGIVSAVRDIPAFGKIIQITVPISPGSSGSPVINSKGEVIGIATLIVTQGQNLNFAVPSDKIITLKESTVIPISDAISELTTDANDAQSLYDRGLKELWQENWSAALAFFQKAKETNPQDADVWFYLGYCYDELGRYQDEIEAYKQAIRIKPDLAEAHYNLGFAYDKLGRYEDAIESHKQAIRIKPDDADAHYILGVTYGNLDRYQDAIEPYKQAIRINPDYAEAHGNLGFVYLNLGRYEEAIEASKQSIRIKPDLAETHYNLGIAYVKIRDKDSALQEYKILKNLDSESANELFNLIYSSDEGGTGGQSASETANVSDVTEHFLYHNSEGHFSLTIPAGWEEIPEDAIVAYDKMLREELGYTSASTYDVAFQKISETYFTYPYIMLQIDKRGRWPENETKKLLSSDNWEKGVQQGVHTVEEQLPTLIQNSKVEQPIYDKEKNIIFTKVESEVAGVGKIVMLTAAILSNYGSINLYCYSAQDDFENDLPYFTRIIDSFRYDIGYEYNQFIKNKNSDAASGSLFGVGLIVFICVGLVILAVIIVVRKSSVRSNSFPETLQASVQPSTFLPSIQILEEESTQMVLASTGQRFGTMILDYIFYFIFAFILGIVSYLIGLGDVIQNMNDNILGIIILIIYYVPQETFSGRTLGKLITGTKAVSEDGTNLTFGQALGRTLCRFIPFEAFSFLGRRGMPRGWHDKIPKTKVISLRRTQKGAAPDGDIL